MNNALEIRSLRKQFPGFTLQDLDLTLPQGCVLGLVGENGAGKSTTFRLILGQLAKDGGSVRILGRDHLDNPAAIKEELGVVPDEIGLPGCLTGKQVARIMAATFRNWENKTFLDLSRRLALPLDKPVSALSKGNRMKLGITVALSHRPKLLLLDEATSGLDPVVRDQVMELLEDFTRQEDHAVLFSSHIVSDLERICDYVAFLHKGRLLLCEEKDVLLGRYCLARGTAEAILRLDPAKVLHRRLTPFGAEALVLREQDLGCLQTGPVTLEELFVLMVKEDEA